MKRIDFIRTSVVRVITLGFIFIMAFAIGACDATSNPNEVNPSESPSITAGATSEVTTATGTESTGTPTNTGTPATTDEPFNTADPTGTAQTAEPTLAPTVSSTVEPTKTPTKEPTQVPTKEPTKAPTPTPTAVAKPTADPAIYPDDFGEAGPNNSYRTDGKVFFWAKTRHMVEIPEELQGWVYPEIVDVENEQAFFTTGFFTQDTFTYYAIKDGAIYKLNQGKIVNITTNGADAFGWVEEDGTACSIGVRSKYWNEVYIEGTNCIEIGYDFTGKLVIANQLGEIVETNKEDILRKSIVVK